MTGARKPIHPTVLCAITCTLTDALREHFNDVTEEDVEPYVADFLANIQLAVVLREAATKIRAASEEGEEWTPESVTDPAGNQVWAGPSAVDDAIIRELSWLRSEIKKSSADTTARYTIMRMIDTRLARLRGAVAPENT